MLIHVLLATWLPLDEQCQCTTRGESMSDATARRIAPARRTESGRVKAVRPRTTTLAPPPTLRDREAGHRNLMCYIVTSCQLRANNQDWDAQGRRRWHLGERMDDGSTPCAGGLRERCLVAWCGDARMARRA